VGKTWFIRKKVEMLIRLMDSRCLRHLILVKTYGPTVGALSE